MTCCVDRVVRGSMETVTSETHIPFREQTARTLATKRGINLIYRKLQKRTSVSLTHNLCYVQTHSGSGHQSNVCILCLWSCRPGGSSSCVPKLLNPPSPTFYKSCFDHRGIMKPLNTNRWVISYGYGKPALLIWTLSTGTHFNPHVSRVCGLLCFTKVHLYLTPSVNILKAAQWSFGLKPVNNYLKSMSKLIKVCQHAN